MKSIDVKWLKPNALDQIMMRDILSDKLFSPVRGYEFNHNPESMSEGVLVVPGAFWKVDDVNDMIQHLNWVLIIIISDEMNTFEFGKLNHPNMKLWVQTPRADRDYGDARLFGVGYAHSRDFINLFNNDKTIDVFTSGQNTHERRSTIFRQLHEYSANRQDLKIITNETKGFRQGFNQRKYYRLMDSAKVVPAPSGIISPDSFRLYEALEYGCVPIADDISPYEDYDSKGYWQSVLGDAPFPVLQDDDIKSHLDASLGSTTEDANIIRSWWIRKKREYCYWVKEDIDSLIGEEQRSTSYKDRLTIVIPVSPWKSHPSTYVLDKTIESVRNHFQDVEIIVTFDGVREEQKDKFDDYQEFVRRSLIKINKEKNIIPIVFFEHTHQVGMMREAMKYVMTGTIIYLEGDFCLEDKYFPWSDILDKLETDDFKLIRFYRFNEIPEEHDYLMKHDKSVDIPEGKIIPTSQWSQQPHIAKSDLYARILSDNFSDEAKCFIEDKVYYDVYNDCHNGKWDDWKMGIYIRNDGDTLTYHQDGRDGETKYDQNQVW